MHGLGFPSVLFARSPRLVEPADGQNIRATAPAFGVHFFGLDLNTGQTNTRNAALHAGEIFGNHGARQAHRLKIQTAPIRRNHRDAHFGHDLQKAGIDRIAIAPHRIEQAAFDQAARDTVSDGILRQISIHRGGTATDQHGKVMRINAFGRPHVDGTKRAQAFLRQP